MPDFTAMRTTMEHANSTSEAIKALNAYEALGLELPGEFLHHVMDLTAADGVNGNAPIDWTELMASAATLAHDVGGIIQHINRETGELEDFFVPRSARV